MTDDDDIRAILPEMPPPAPKPRDTAIAAALTRFDARSEGNDAQTYKQKSQPALWQKKISRPYTALIAATLLAVTISVPFALQNPGPFAPPAMDGTSPSASAVKVRSQTGHSSEPATKPSLPSPPNETGAVSMDEISAETYDIAQNTVSEKAAQVAAAAPALAAPPAPAPPPPAPPPPPPPPMVPNESPKMGLQRRASSQIAQDSSPAVAIASAAEAYSDEDAVVVTGSRVSRDKSRTRGDWNACTVNDPIQAIARCRKLADKAEKGVRSQAETYLSEGLNYAWSGRLDKAIAAFDAALLVAPNLPAAYLNRGLVYDRLGRTEDAIADLNRAVSYAPRSARSYYNRSVILRKYGDPKRALLDERQAVRLDSRYQQVLK